MSDEKEETKIAKLAEKKKTKDILKILKKADNEVVKTALPALSSIGDEDSINCITSYLDDADASVKITAAKAAMALHSEYLKTQVRRVFSTEKDPEVQKELLAALNS